MEASKEYDLGFKAGLEYGQMKLKESLEWEKLNPRRFRFVFVFKGDRDSSIYSDYFSLSPGYIYYHKATTKPQDLTEIGIKFE